MDKYFRIAFYVALTYTLAHMESLAHHTHALTGLLVQLLLFFGIAGLVVPSLQRMRVTPVIGYLLSGIIVGPFGLGQWADEHSLLRYVTINNTNTVHLIGELGVITMLFMIGLELSFQRLKELKNYVLGLGSAQIILTGAVIASITYAFTQNMAMAILLGASMALSSTAIVMQMLQEYHLSNRDIGSLCFSILLMQDLAVVPILVLASAFTGDSDMSIPLLLIQSLLIGVAAVTGIYIVGRVAMRPLLRVLSVTRSPEWLMAFVLFIVIASASVTHYAGLSAALGAFLAGLLIAETDCVHAVEVIMEPLKGLLLGIFFLYIGMMIDLSEIWRTPVMLSLAVAGIFLIKTIILFPLCRAFHVPSKRAIEASMMLSQPGEFAFLILGLAAATGMMPRADVQFFLLVTAIAMAMTPFMFKFAPWVSGWLEQHSLGGDDIPPPPVEGKVLIAGFGRMGRKIADTLESQHIPYIAVEYNLQLVREWKKKGYNVLYGDATQGVLWHSVGAQYASAMVVTVDNYAASEKILSAVHREWPLMPTIMRARDVCDTQHFYSLGAAHVVPELEESSRQLAQALLEHMGMRPEEAFEALRIERQYEAYTPVSTHD